MRALGEVSSQTDAIFKAIHEINASADADSGTIRLSIDTKATVGIGNLSRGGKSRSAHQALDHDLEAEAKLTPFGIHRPGTGETWLSITTGHATADFMVDRYSEIWPTRWGQHGAWITGSSSRLPFPPGGCKGDEFFQIVEGDGFCGGGGEKAFHGCCRAWTMASEDFQPVLADWPDRVHLVGDSP